MKSLLAIPVVGLYLATWVLTLYLFFEGNMAEGIGCAVFVLLLTLIAVKGNSRSSQQGASLSEDQWLRQTLDTNLRIMARLAKETDDKVEYRAAGLTSALKSVQDRIANIEERL